VYSSPTLADLDHDGHLEILMGTSVGYVYVLNRFGNPLPGWPVQMGEIQARSCCCRSSPPLLLGSGFVWCHLALAPASACCCFSRY
jgi:hypothetical protein